MILGLEFRLMEVLFTLLVVKLHDESNMDALTYY